LEAKSHLHTTFVFKKANLKRSDIDLQGPYLENTLGIAVEDIILGCAFYYTSN
jgi:hypothetical protein